VIRYRFALRESRSCSLEIHWLVDGKLCAYSDHDKIANDQNKGQIPVR